MFLGVDFRGWILSLIIVGILVWSVLLIRAIKKKGVEGLKGGVIFVFVILVLVVLLDVVYCLKPVDNYTVWQVFIFSMLVSAALFWLLSRFQKIFNKKIKGEENENFKMVRWDY